MKKAVRIPGDEVTLEFLYCTKTKPCSVDSEPGPVTQHCCTCSQLTLALSTHSLGSVGAVHDRLGQSSLSPICFVQSLKGW